MTPREEEKAALPFPKTKAPLFSGPAKAGGKAENIVRADGVKAAQPGEVPEGKLVDAGFIAGIDLLSGAQKGGKVGLGEVAVLPQLTQALIIGCHGDATSFRSG